MRKLATSIYGQAKGFVDSSAVKAQFGTGAAIGAATFGAYGAAKGVYSSDSTVVGGAVGGASFGAGVGAAAAYALNKNAGLRSAASKGLRRAGAYGRLKGR